MAEAAHLVERVLAVVGAASLPDAPWWRQGQQLWEEMCNPLPDGTWVEQTCTELPVEFLLVAIITLLFSMSRKLRNLVGAMLAFMWRKTIGRWWRDWWETRTHLRAQITAERQRELLVASMRRVWVDGYLGSALDLDAIRYLLPVRLVEADGRPAHRHADQVEHLIGVWDRSDRQKLRLTGDWGTGKTVHLLLLARCLLDRAKENHQQPTEAVPVVLNVSNWDAKDGTFDHWLLNEVARRHSRHRHDVDRDALRKLLIEGDLVLLLDGVDEHADPAGCANAIKVMLDHHVALRVVVSYRTDPARPSRQHLIEQHLDWLDEVQVQPLDTVDGLLADADDDWPGVREVIAANADLWEPLIRRPLLLAVIMRAFRGKRADAIPVLHGSVEDRQAELYAAYLDWAVRQGLPPSGQPAPAWEADAFQDGTLIRKALGWLADAADRCRLGTTVYLEQTAPAWLPDPRVQDRTRRRRTLVLGLTYGLAFGLVAWLVSELVAGVAFGLKAGLVAGVAFGLVASLTVSMVVGPLAGLVSGVIVALGMIAFGLILVAYSLVAGLPAALTTGLLSALAVALAARRWKTGPPTIATQAKWSVTAAKEDWPPRLAGGLAWVVIWALAFGLHKGLRAGLIAGLCAVTYPLFLSTFNAFSSVLGEAPYPSLIRRAALGKLTFGLTYGLAFGLAAGVVGELAAGLGIGLVVGFAMGLLGALPAVSYLVVHRALRRAGLFPGRSLTGFLDWCVAHRLLLPVGYGYRFLHPTFQEHLAREWRREHSAKAGSGSHESGVTARR